MAFLKALDFIEGIFIECIVRVFKLFGGGDNDDDHDDEDINNNNTNFTFSESVEFSLMTHENYKSRQSDAISTVPVSTSPTPTTTSTPSSSAPNTESSTLTDSISTNPSVTTWTPSGLTLNSESVTWTESMTSNTTSAAEDSLVEVAALSCLAVVFVVVVVVAVFFLWKRKRQANGVRKENNPICISAAAYLQHSQDSFHVYDKLSRENKRANIDNASTGAANSRDTDNDDYTYIDGPAINKGVVRLHQDKPGTTAGEHALTDPSVSGLHSDLPSTYRLARVTDNDAPDSLPPDYFILEERDKKGCPEPTQYFILEDMGEKKSAADTDAQQYFILEERREGGGRESAPQRLSSRSEADYFELENDDGQEPECADSARSDASREEAEYCRLDPNSRQESEYTLLSRPPQPPDTIGDNPYCLASYPE